MPLTAPTAERPVPPKLGIDADAVVTHPIANNFNSAERTVQVAPGVDTDPVRKHFGHCDRVSMNDTKVMAPERSRAEKWLANQEYVGEILALEVDGRIDPRMHEDGGSGTAHRPQRL
jgi:hypothetical protein